MFEENFPCKYILNDRRVNQFSLRFTSWNTGFNQTPCPNLSFQSFWLRGFESKILQLTPLKIFISSDLWSALYIFSLIFFLLLTYVKNFFFPPWSLFHYLMLIAIKFQLNVSILLDNWIRYFRWFLKNFLAW